MFQIIKKEKARILKQTVLFTNQERNHIVHRVSHSDAFVLMDNFRFVLEFVQINRYVSHHKSVDDEYIYKHKLNRPFELSQALSISMDEKMCQYVNLTKR